MSRHLSLLLLSSLIVLEVDMITSIIPRSCLYGRCLMVSPSAMRWAQLSGDTDLMFKRADRVREIRREELPWARLKRGPDEKDAANLEDGARTKKRRERVTFSFTDWARLKRGLGSWMMLKRGAEADDDEGWIRMM